MVTIQQLWEEICKERALKGDPEDCLGTIAKPGKRYGQSSKTKRRRYETLDTDDCSDGDMGGVWNIQ